MLNVEQKAAGESDAGNEAGNIHTSGPLTYGSYLRVPELLDLQSPVKVPHAHDEMLFIIVQQVQELWFKQILFELDWIIQLLSQDEILRAVKMLERVNRIVKAVSDEVSILGTMPPHEFQKFRNVLAPSSGFESEQFRELEWASGLREHTFLKLVEKHSAGSLFEVKWPVSLHDAFVRLLAPLGSDPVDALVAIYANPESDTALYYLAEALSEYELLFNEWRFHHVKLVERTIGDHSPGTAGSSGAGYLGKTLGYRFFPELWEARNRITASAK